MKLKLKTHDVKIGKNLKTTKKALQTETKYEAFIHD